MNFFNEPCLERMALVTVATTVYSASKSFYFEQESCLPLHLFPDEELEAIFKEEMSQTHLPKSLQQQVMWLIRPISFEVEAWRERHSNILDLNLDVRKYLYWKSEGTIDRRRTAVQLIRSHILPISKSFMLACVYCLREFAKSLWMRMSESQRRIALFDENDDSYSLVKYYISNFQGRNIELHVNDCSTVVSLRFLLAQSTPEQRRFSLLFAVRLNWQDTHILRYCLSQMEGKDLEKVFEYYPFEVLSCFLEWPWQSHFINVANHLWDHLHIYDFCSFLRFILNQRITQGWKDFDYEELLLQFWCQSPSNFRDYVKQDQDFDKTLLISILNKHNVQLP